MRNVTVIENDSFEARGTDTEVDSFESSDTVCYIGTNVSIPHNPTYRKGGVWGRYHFYHMWTW